MAPKPSAGAACRSTPTGKALQHLHGCGTGATHWLQCIAHEKGRPEAAFGDCSAIPGRSQTGSQGLAGGVSAFFFAASVAALAASSADEAPGEGAGVAAGAAGGATCAGGGVTTAGGASSFFPQADRAAAAISDASNRDFFIGKLLWMKMAGKKF